LKKYLQDISPNSHFLAFDPPSKEALGAVIPAVVDCVTLNEACKRIYSDEGFSGLFAIKCENSGLLWNANLFSSHLQASPVCSLNAITHQFWKVDKDYIGMGKRTRIMNTLRSSTTSRRNP
jgi:hypothetical protein